MNTKISSRSRALRAVCALALGAGMALPALAQVTPVNLQFSASAVPQPWYLGDTHPVTFTVINSGTTASTGGAAETVSFSIPLETSITSALPAGCTGGPQILVCQLPSLAPGANATFAFDIQGIATYLPPGNGLDLRFRADPTYDPMGGAAPVQHAAQFFANPLPFFIIDRPVAPVAVPTLDLMGLGLLGAAVGALGMRRRKQAKKS